MERYPETERHRVNQEGGLGSIRRMGRYCHRHGRVRGIGHLWARRRDLGALDELCRGSQDADETNMAGNSADPNRPTRTGLSLRRRSGRRRRSSRERGLSRRDRGLSRRGRGRGSCDGGWRCLRHHCRLSGGRRLGRGRSRRRRGEVVGSEQLVAIRSKGEIGYFAVKTSLSSRCHPFLNRRRRPRHLNCENGVYGVA